MADQSPLENVPLFAGLKSRERRELEANLHRREYAPGAEILAEGEGGIAFFVLVEGEASVTRGGEELRKLGPGDYAGEMALIDGQARSASVTAATDVVVLGLTQLTFRPWVERHPDVAWTLMR
ncbi:MAG TPA: cyclic nucleotide-binding domain-containing protein, partial [Solirubrobacteraceae bacterium]